MIRTRNYYSKESESLPNYIYNSAFMCTECFFQPIHFKERYNECPASSCHRNIDATRAVGITILELLDKLFSFGEASYDKISSNKLAKMNKEIKKTAEMFNNNRKLSDSDCKKLISHYCFQFNLGYNSTQKIKAIIVKDLFDEKSYFYNFNDDNDISVILGPNGIGKTTVFRMLRILFSNENSVRNANGSNYFNRNNLDSKNGFGFLFDIPFSLFKVIFTYGAYVKVTKDIKDIDNIKLIIEYGHSTGQGGFDSISPEVIIYSKDNEYNNSIAAIEEHYANIDMLFNRLNDYNKFLYIKTNRMNDVDMIEQHVGDFIENNYVNLLSKHVKLRDNPKAMGKKIKENVISRFRFETQSNINLDFTNRLKKYYDDLWNIYETILYDNNYVIEIDKKYDKRFNEIFRFGYKFGYDIAPMIDEINNSKKVVTLNMDLETYEKNEELYYHLDKGIDLIKRYKTFIKTYRDFFANFDNRNKRITFDDLFGLCVINKNSKIKIDNLSSGEINLISILYHLIFDVDEGAIVLIDEPEISLHISWQQHILDYILSLVKGKGIQIIIASHSPFVTSRHENLLTYGIHINNRTKQYLIDNKLLFEEDLKNAGK